MNLHKRENRRMDVLHLRQNAKIGLRIRPTSGEWESRPAHPRRSSLLCQSFSVTNTSLPQTLLMRFAFVQSGSPRAFTVPHKFLNLDRFRPYLVMRRASSRMDRNISRGHLYTGYYAANTRDYLWQRKIIFRIRFEQLYGHQTREIVALSVAVRHKDQSNCDTYSNGYLERTRYQ